MEKIWLKSYPQGVAAEIDSRGLASLAELLEVSCRRYRDKPAYTNMGATLSYADLDRLSLQFAAYLQQTLRLERGERVAVMLPNLLQHPVATFGVLRAGLIVVNVNPLCTPRELKHQLADSGATAIVILENFAHVLAEVLPHTSAKHIVITRMGDLLHAPKSALVNFAVKHAKRMVPAYSLPGAVNFRAALKKGAGLTLRKTALMHDDIAFLQYTGGTTGVAKGAILTHGNMVANVQQVAAWFKGVLEEGRETVITPLPLYHIFALTVNCLVFIRIGGLNRLITNPRDLRGFVKELAQAPFSFITGVNTLYNALLNTPGFSDLDFSHLKFTIGGGMAVQPPVAERWHQRTGVVVLEGYGLTETAPVVCINPVNLTEFSGCVGLPVASTEACVRDDDGNTLACDEVGELCVRGPQVMRGYWNQPEETRKVFDEAGWIHTGDVACIDTRGFVRIVDRKKDMILVSGYNVYPNEIEAVVAAHPGVLEVGAIGVSDGARGEAVKICVVRKDPTLTAAALRAYCRQHLTTYKMPKRIEFRDELPKTSVGKILRRVLREQVTPATGTRATTTTVSS
ncbi:MAG: AMP-binding protein [Pseudomonadota bacterium]|nr:AMP-binding protein [Pseudomonadota bacterium]